MGIVTAAYALGAAVSPALFSAAVSAGGFAAAMTGLAVALALAAPACGLALRASGLDFGRGVRDGAGRIGGGQPIGLLWIAYGAGVAAGLMAIGHAAGIAEAAGWRGAGWITPAVIAVFNMAGSFAGGWLMDRAAPARVLAGLPLFSAAALAILPGAGGGAAMLAMLGAVGFGYGATIAMFPAAIAKIFGVAAGARVYGKVFTAWGAAGLVAPWFAGYLFDRTGGYGIAIYCAAGLSLMSAAAALALSRHGPGSVSG